MAQLNTRTILEYLAQFGLDGQTYSLNDLLKEYYPNPTISQYIGLRTMFREMKENKLIHISADFEHLGDSWGGVKQDFDNVKIMAKLRQAGLDSFEKRKENAVQNFYITNSSYVMINSPNGTIKVNVSEIHNVINEAKNAVLTDNSIKQELKDSIVETLNTAETEISKGKIEKVTITKILEYAAKIGGVGSFLLNLAKMLEGI